jgi:Double-GTPase 2
MRQRELTITDAVPCPYCGARIVLGDCPIVATNFDVESAGDKERLVPISRAKVNGVTNGYPIIDDGPNKKVGQQRFAQKLRGSAKLPLLSSSTAPEDLAARACTSCGEALPNDIDSRTIHTIAVVGTNGASKTHFLTALLHEAATNQALKPLGCTEFSPDESTAQRFQDDYFRPLFKDRLLHQPTQRVDMEGIVRRPLRFRVTFETVDKPILLLFHDVSGESLVNTKERARHLSFLRRATGIIFLVDPWWFPRVSEHLESQYGFGSDHGSNQAHLLEALINDAGPNFENIPLSIAVSKADLLRDVLQKQMAFEKPTPKDRETWINQLEEIDKEVQELLTNEFPVPDLMAAAERAGNPTFHAVAPLGSQPDNSFGTVGSIQPMRCLDPLVSILLRSRAIGI